MKSKPAEEFRNYRKINSRNKGQQDIPFSDEIEYEGVQSGN